MDGFSHSRRCFFVLFFEKSARERLKRSPKRRLCIEAGRYSPTLAIVVNKCIIYAGSRVNRETIVRSAIRSQSVEQRREPTVPGFSIPQPQLHAPCSAKTSSQRNSWAKMLLGYWLMRVNDQYCLFSVDRFAVHEPQRSRRRQHPDSNVTWKYNGLTLWHASLINFTSNVVRTPSR